MKAFVPLLAAATVSLAFTQAPLTEEPTAAPRTHTENAPSEALLSPPPDAEKLPLPPGYVEVRNPAFPNRAPPPPPAPRGRRYGLEELSPYFAEGPLKGAKEAFDKGRYARARALLEGQGESPPVRYLRAISAVRAEEHALAAAEMASLAEDYPAMRDRCLTHAGVALESLGRFSDAALALAQVSEDSRLYPEARLTLGRVLRKAKDFDAALAALAPLALRSSPLWGRNIAAEALLASADIAAEKKDREREREALWRLWASHPLSPQARQAERRLKGLKPSLEVLVERGEQLVELHRNSQGLRVLEPLLPRLELPEPLACRARFIYGKGLRKQREHTRAIAVLAPVAEQCEDPELLPRVLYVLGSSRSIVDQARGPETYERLARDFPDHSFADDALFFAADLYAKTGRPEQASQRLKELARLYPQGDFLGEALFKDFWLARKARAPDGGLALLEQIEQRFADADETYDVERARYWRARTLQERGEVQAAAELFEQLAVEHPATYYGLMARTMLGEVEPERMERVTPRLDFTGQERREPWPLHVGELEKDPHFLSAVELLR
ncbi:MAG TPA: tetratricopeptide repeat protein, partial [Myxococcaceae bacterium]|nr:tetratricopeptide repeat protein [Myxococcaceae bacterium]